MARYLRNDGVRSDRICLHPFKHICRNWMRVSVQRFDAGRQEGEISQADDKSLQDLLHSRVSPG